MFIGDDKLKHLELKITIQTWEQAEVLIKRLKR